MKKLALLFVLILCGVSTQAQAVRFGDGQPIFVAERPGGLVHSVANAIINFCTSPAINVPCVNKATTYTDASLSVACPTNVQIVLAGTANCVGTTDGYGNWGVWVAAGNYSYTVTIPGGFNMGPYFVTLASGGGGGGNPGGTSGQLQYNNSGAFGGFTLNGDCSITVPGIVCTRTNGTAFAASATINALNASNINSGTLSGSFMSSVNLAISGNGGVFGNLSVNNLNGGAGASGSTVWCGNGTWCTPSGAGNVSVVGTPVSGQLAQWTGGTTIQGINFPLQINSVNNTSQLGLNHLTSTLNVLGLQIIPSNPATNQIKYELTGVNEAANLFIASPNGSTGAMSLRAIQVGDIPILNQNTTGTAANLSGTPALPNGVTVTTQALGDSSGKAASDGFVLANALTNPLTLIGQIIGAGTGGAATAVAPGKTGQTVGAVNGAIPSFVSQGVSGRTVTGTTDSVLCDSSTAIQDRGTTIIYTSTSNAAITVPQAGSTGCAANFVFAVAAAPGSGSPTFTFTPTTSTLTIVNGATVTAGATSLALTKGQYATFNSIDNTNYIVRVVSGTGSGSSGPLMAVIASKSSNYTLTSADGTDVCTAALTFTLPTTGISAAQQFVLKNGTTTVNCTITSTVNIDFSGSQTLTPGQSVTVQWDGSQYWQE